MTGRPSLPFVLGPCDAHTYVVRGLSQIAIPQVTPVWQDCEW